MTARAIIAAAAFAFSLAGYAQPSDPRIQILAYEANQVVNLSVSPGYAAVVELGSDEAIQNVVVGNNSVWEITPNSSSDRIIVKPLSGATTTNMVVITDMRRYTFLLDPFGANQGLFVLRFTYPDTPRAAASQPTSIATYRMSGAKSLYPATMHDDGIRTTIRWAEQTALPAVFAVGDKGKEEIVNGRMIDSEYVVEGIATRFVFRLGDVRAVASRRMIKVRK